MGRLYLKNVELKFDPWMAMWHSVHDWKKLAWLWNEGAPGALLKLDVV
jgi:hypothetical protein